MDELKQLKVIDPEYRERLFSREFRRPRKIDNSEKTEEILLRVSKEQKELLRSYASGFSIFALARAWQCNPSTLVCAIRDALRPAFGMKENSQQERK